LQLGGSKLPLFCVHPGSGEVLVLVNLASRFAGDRPFYALRARGLASIEECYGTFEEMVGAYTAAIRRRQLQGPYALAGYSYGAPVAFEIAKALEADGEMVAFLGSIDGTAFIGETRLDAIDSAVILAFFLSLIDRQQLRELPDKLRGVGEEVYSQLLKLAPPRRTQELDLDLDRFRSWARLSHALVQLGGAYIPSGTIESVTVFHAEPVLGTQEDWLRELHRWDGLARSPNRYIAVAGQHHTLLDSQHVAGLHAVLRGEIDRAMGGQ
jgi:thioesterase domain-containing protein